jgi:putative addiction module component (TIGR02574 family)
MNESLVDKIRKLPLDERLQLVEAIWDTIADETPATLGVGEADIAELERRWAAHQAAPDEAVSWEQVRKKLFKET